MEGVPHHVTQRGARRQAVFFSDDDYGAYRTLLAEGCRAAGVEVWACCLMRNPVHLILVPADAGGPRAALSEARRRYSRRVNFREGWRGYHRRERFASTPMDEDHLMAAAREDGVARVAPLLDRRPDWAAFLEVGLAPEAHRRSGRPNAPDGRSAARTSSRPWSALEIREPATPAYRRALVSRCSRRSASHILIRA